MQRHGMLKSRLFTGIVRSHGALKTHFLKVSPNSFFAFDIFVDYCKLEGIARNKIY